MPPQYLGYRILILVDVVGNNVRDVVTIPPVSKVAEHHGWIFFQIGGGRLKSNDTEALEGSRCSWATLAGIFQVVLLIADSDIVDESWAKGVRPAHNGVMPPE